MTLDRWLPICKSRRLSLKNAYFRVSLWGMNLLFKTSFKVQGWKVRDVIPLVAKLLYKLMRTTTKKIFYAPKRSMKKIISLGQERERKEELQWWKTRPWGSVSLQLGWLDWKWRGAFNTHLCCLLSSVDWTFSTSLDSRWYHLSHSYVSVVCFLVYTVRAKEKEELSE